MEVLLGARLHLIYLYNSVRISLVPICVHRLNNDVLLFQNCTEILYLYRTHFISDQQKELSCSFIVVGVNGCYRGVLF
jgi:hypothetical protein